MLVFSFIKLYTSNLLGLTATVSAPGEDLLSSELDSRDIDYTLTSRNFNDAEGVEDNQGLGDFDPGDSLLGELSEMSETESLPYYLGNQANKGKNAGEKVSRWNSSIRRKSYSKGKPSWRRKSTAEGKSSVKGKPIVKGESSVKVKSKEESAEERSECTLNLPGDKASTSDFPIPIGKHVNFGAVKLLLQHSA